MKKNQLDDSIELKDLVYAPLGAISSANIKLSSSIIEFLESTGDASVDASGKPVVQLRTIQMMYEQLRSDSADNTVADSIGLEVPLLSIYPLSSLKVSKTKVSFATEIKNMAAGEDDVKLYTKIASQNQRESANSPKFSFEVELDSSPVPEGLARFIDTLNAQAIPKLINSKPVDNTGRKLSGKELEEYYLQEERRKRENDLQRRLAEIKTLIREKTNALNLETGMNYEEYTDHIQCMGKGFTPTELYTVISDYQEIAQKLEEELDGIRTEVVLDKVTAPVAEDNPNSNIPKSQNNNVDEVEDDDEDEEDEEDEDEEVEYEDTIEDLSSDDEDVVEEDDDDDAEYDEDDYYYEEDVADEDDENNGESEGCKSEASCESCPYDHGTKLIVDEDDDHSDGDEEKPRRRKRK